MNAQPAVLTKVASWFQHYIDALRSVVVTPRDFFQRTRDETDLWPPTFFVLISLLLPKLIYALVFAPVTLGLSIATFPLSALISFLLFLLLAVMLFGILRLFGVDARMDRMYGTVAYCHAANYLILIPIPFINLFAFIIGFSILFYIAMREAHGLSQNQAIGITLVPAVFTLILGLIKTITTLGMLITIVYQFGQWMMP